MPTDFARNGHTDLGGRAPVYLHRCHSLSALGDEHATAAAMAAGRNALVRTPVLGAAGPAATIAGSSKAHGASNPPAAGDAYSAPAPPLTEAEDCVPLALLSPMSEALPPRWWQPLLRFAAPLADAGWGTRRRPVFITGSNYGVDNLYALCRDRNSARDDWAAQHGIVARLRAALHWGHNVTVLSHACVSAQLGLLLAERALQNNQADEALVFSFDFLSPFVTGGFHALKILNTQFPQPYLRRQTGAIALGDGAAWAILSRTPSAHRILGQSAYNEMHHFTANAADGSGFRCVLEPLRPLTAGRKLLIKGHGTGTLEAAELEVRACMEAFGTDAPLVSWKGAIGHTLGSCALVELAIALAARELGTFAPTVFAGAAEGEPFGPNVATQPLPAACFDTTLLLSNAFGGAHAAMLIAHE